MSIYSDKEGMLARQEAMRERLEKNQEAAEVRESIKEDVFCPYCNVLTKTNQTTGEVLPCKSCVMLKLRLQKYNLKIFEYKMILQEQKNKCAICLIDFDCKTRSTTPHVDHCHELNHVRGLLCANCNHGLGLFGDDLDSMENAVKYLKRNLIRRSWSAVDDF